MALRSPWHYLGWRTAETNQYYVVSSAIGSGAIGSGAIGSGAIGSGAIGSSDIGIRAAGTCPVSLHAAIRRRADRSRLKLSLTH